MKPIEILKELIKFRSLTPSDDGAFNYVSMLLADFSEDRFELNGVTNAIFTKRFGQGPHLCFAGHIDVVPPGEGWASDPFVPVEADGFLYGRGAQDMKSGIAAAICALAAAHDFKGTLSLLLTSDEEGDGIYGTREMLSKLREQGALPDFAVVAEPTCEVRFGDTIKIGRRGSINGVLTLTGIGGHAAYPDKCINPVHILAPVLVSLAGHDLDAGSDDFAPAKIVITDIRGGSQVVNVTPKDVRVMFNVRGGVGLGLEDVRDYVLGLFELDAKDALCNESESCGKLEMSCTAQLRAGASLHLALKSSSKPFLTQRSSKIVQKLSASVQKICGAAAELNTAGGTSDARYFAEFGVETAEFGVRNDTIHQINERVEISDVENLAKIFSDLIENFG